MREDAALGVAPKKSHPVPFIPTREGSPNGRRAHAQLLNGFGEVSCFDCADESAQVDETVHR
jgi:hypothetical protein